MSGTAQELDRRCKELARRARQSDAELARALREMRDTGCFRVLGYPRLEPPMRCPPSPDAGSRARLSFTWGSSELCLTECGV